MPEGVYQRGSSWVYYCEAPRDPLTGKRRQLTKGGFPSAKAASAARRARLAELDRGEVGGSRLTLADLLARWLEHGSDGWEERTALGYRGIVSRHLAPALGVLRLEKLTAYHIEEYYRLKRATLSGRTLATHHAILRQAVAAAVRWGFVARNVMAQVRPPRGERRRFPILSVEQTRLLLAHVAGSWLQVPVLLAAAGGLRRGEALALRWEDVEGSVVTVRRSLGQTPRGLEFGPPKGRKERSFALPAFALAVLEERRLEQVRLWESVLLARWTPANLITCDPNGTPRAPGALGYHFRRALREAGLPHVRYHDLRHGALSYQLDSGVPVHVVSQRAGHASAKQTLDTYAHVVRAGDEAAAAALNALLTAPG